MRKWALGIALFFVVGMIGCGGSEYRFGNARTLPNLSGSWTFTAQSQTMPQQFQGTAEVAQSNLGLQGSVNNLFVYCAPNANLSAVMTPTQPFVSTSVTSYSLVVTLQENVTGRPQTIVLQGSSSADGTHMSGTYTAYAGGCTNGDSGAWTANKQ